MTTSNMLSLIALIIVVIYFIVLSIYSENTTNIFFSSFCKKGICNNSIKKCFSKNAYIYDEKTPNSKIERTTYKCIINPNDIHKLLMIDHIFVPSMMNDTYCDLLYTTYYDYTDLFLMKNRMYNLNIPVIKCLRIRKYYFQSGTYIEVKYKGGTKLRCQIDDNFNIVEETNMEDEKVIMFNDILTKIKNKKIKPIFDNTYKRLSFIYKNDPNIRITIDTNIEFFQNDKYKKLEYDIIEFKIPSNINMSQVMLYLKEINDISGLSLKYVDFSKFEYYYNYVLVNSK